MQTLEVTLIFYLDAGEPEPIQFSVKDQMKAEETVSATCSVSYFCPLSPPVFKWSHSGKENQMFSQLTVGQWNATSVLTFQPTHADHRKPLQCSIMYKGAKGQTHSKVLQVKCEYSSLFWAITTKKCSWREHHQNKEEWQIKNNSKPLQPHLGQKAEEARGSVDNISCIGLQHCGNNGGHKHVY